VKIKKYFVLRSKSLNGKIKIVFVTLKGFIFILAGLNHLIFLLGMFLSVFKILSQIQSQAKFWENMKTEKISNHPIALCQEYEIVD
jgi:hypothetical protein